MKIFSKTIIPLFLAAVMLTSCNGFMATPAKNPTDVMETAIPTIAAEPQTLTSTATITTTPQPSPLPPTENSIPMAERIIYYYFVTIPENTPPEGSVVIMPDTLILAPTVSDTAHSSDTATDLRVALETVFNDERNIWISYNLEITSLAFSESRTDVVLDGEYFAVAPIILTAARMQILMTLFSNTSVQTATVTLNGDTIANIDVSRISKPVDYLYTRTEIETFMAEHAYVAP